MDELREYWIKRVAKARKSKNLSPMSDNQLRVAFDAEIRDYQSGFIQAVNEYAKEQGYIGTKFADSEIVIWDTKAIKKITDAELPTAEPGMPEAGVQEVPVKAKLPKRGVIPTTPQEAPAKAREAEKATVPAKPPVPVTPTPEKASLTEQTKQINAELEADISIAKKRISEIKDEDVAFGRLALNDAERLLSRNKTLISRIEKGVAVSQEEINALNDELTSVKDALKFQTKDVAKARQYLTQYVAKNVPISERGKMLSDISKIQGAQDIQAVVAKANQIAEKSEQKRLRVEIGKELKRAIPRKDEGIVKGRFGGDIQAELDITRRNLSMNRDTALEKIVANQQSYEDGKLAYEDMLRDNDHLSRAGIDGMTVAELQETLDYIKSIKEIGRATRLQELEKFKTGMETARKDVVGVVTGGKPVEAGVVKEHHGLGAFWEKIENGQIALTDFLDKLSRFSKSKPYQSALNLFVDNRVHKSYNAEQNGLTNQQTAIKENLERIFGTKKASELNDILRRMGRDKVNLGTFKNTEGKEVKLELTKGQMIDAYNLMQAEQNLPTFTEGNKFTQEMMDAIKNGLTAQEKAWADWTRSYLADYWTSINDVYEPLYGVKLGRNENYWPRSRDVEKSDVPEHILVQEDFNHFASVTNGSLKARTNNKIPFKFLDGNAKLINHVTQMEHFKAWAFTIRDLRSLFMSREVRDAVNQYHGREILGKVNDYINVLARGGIEKSKRVAALDTLRGNVAVAVLGIKPMIAVKQPTALLGYAVGMPYKDFITGVGDFLTNPIAKYKILYEKSAGLRARYKAGQYERDLKVGVEGGAPKNISGKANWKENVLTLIQLGDKLGTVPGMWSKYQSALKEGKSDADAILEAEKLTNRTQNTSQLFSLSTIQHGGSWARLFTMFQDQPNKYFRLIDANARNLINGREGKAKAITSIFILWVVIPSLFQFMSDAFKWRPERQARAVILGPINDLLIFGQMAQSAVGWLAGENYPYEPSPVLQIADDIKSAISKAQKLIRDGQDPFKDIKVDDLIDMVEFLAKGAGMASGVPTPYLVQIERALRGEEGNRDLRELLYSRWALEEPKPENKKKMRDVADKLGTIILEDVPAGKIPQPFNTKQGYSEFKAIMTKTLPSDVTVKKGFSPMDEMWAKTIMAEQQKDSLVNKKLYEIIEDIEKDATLNYNISQYYFDWQARSKIESLEDLKEWDKVHPSGERGNLTPEQFSLLLKYEQANKAERAKMRQDIEDLAINPRQAWLKKDAKQNALLAISGQAKIMSLEAYNEAKRLIKELDIPDNAVSDFIPPDDVAKDSFAYQDAVEKFSGNSPQAKLIRAKNPKLTEFLRKTSPDIEDVDEPIKALELKVKTYDKTKEYTSFSDKESPNYKDDTIKDANGKTARDIAQEEFKAKNKDWLEDSDRIEAHSKGTKGNPTPDTTVEKWMEHGQVSRQSKGYDAEEKVWYLDNPDVHKWALENKLTNDDGSKWNEPVLRIQVKPENRKTEKQIADLKEKLPDISDKKDPAYKTGYQYAIEQLYKSKEGKAYRDDQDRIEAYQNDGAEFVEKWVEGSNLSREFSGNSAEKKVWLVDNPLVHAWAKNKGLLKDLDPEKDWNIPALRIDVKWREKDAEYDAIDPDAKNPETNTRLRDEFLQLPKNEEYRKDSRRRDAYKLKDFPESQVEKYVEYYENEAKGFRQERFLKDDPEFYKEVWLGVMKKDRKDFRKVPDVEYDNLYDEFREQFDKWDAYGDPNNKKLYIADPDERRIMREKLLGDSDFADAKLKRTAYSLLIGNEKYVPDYVEYENIINEGKPKGSEIWYADDRYLKEHQEFYRKMRELGYWTQEVNFDKIPTEKFERFYNEHYSNLPKGSARLRFRETNPWFEEEGVKMGFWKSLEKSKGGLGLSEIEDILNKKILSVK